MVAAHALWVIAPRAAELRAEDVDAPGLGEVRVRAIASAISHGTEMLVYRGQVHPDLALDLPTLVGSYALPVKFGYASVGRVEATGAGVTGLQVGQTVFVHYPHQDVYLVSAERVTSLPPRVEPESACLLANLETALNALLDAPLRLGEVVVIFGQGIIGLLLLQLVLRAGAGTVIVVDPFERRRALSAALGASVMLAADSDAPAAVLDTTQGRGADIIFEASGNPAALQTAMACAAFQGSIVACSWYGAKQASLDLGRDFHRRRLRLVSSQVSNLDPALAPRWDRARRLAVALDLLPRLRLPELISHRIPFAEATEAYSLIDQHPERTVQVLLTYGA
jgi:2-desacetyl-2-hydroxyethyl bacteriochlorophyllide A dehydrogenase